VGEIVEVQRDTEEKDRLFGFSAKLAVEVQGRKGLREYEGEEGRRVLFS
jgi:hypothetical protein